MRTLIFAILGICLFTPVSSRAWAQTSKTTPTPTGYEEAWVGIGRGGADSVYHRAFITRRTPATDTLLVIYRNGDRRLFVLHADATLVALELSWFKKYLTIDEYPETHERLLDRGWRYWYEGVPRRHLRTRFRDVTIVTIHPAGGVELPITPKYPD